MEFKKGRCSVAEEVGDAKVKEDVEDNIQTEATEDDELETRKCGNEEDWNMELLWEHQARHIQGLSDESCLSASRRELGNLTSIYNKLKKMEDVPVEQTLTSTD